MRGYRDRPEATAATLAPGGWLRTGDLCYVDADGYLFVVDRLKELIKYKAYQVAPAELEAPLCAHPAVADAAVVPRPDPDAGELPVAHVATRSEVSAAELEAGSPTGSPPTSGSAASASSTWSSGPRPASCSAGCLSRPSGPTRQPGPYGPTPSGPGSPSPRPAPRGGGRPRRAGRPRRGCSRPSPG
jgi:hypothetical protein